MTSSLKNEQLRNFDSNSEFMRKIERIIRAIAGSLVTISLALGYLVSPYWYLFMGLNLLQSFLVPGRRDIEEGQYLEYLAQEKEVLNQNFNIKHKSFKNGSTYFGNQRL